MGCFISAVLQHEPSPHNTVSILCISAIKFYSCIKFDNVMITTYIIIDKAYLCICGDGLTFTLCALNASLIVHVLLLRHRLNL